MNENGYEYYIFLLVEVSLARFRYQKAPFSSEFLCILLLLFFPAVYLFKWSIGYVT